MVRLADGRTIVLSEGADDDPRGREALLYVGDPAEPGPEPIRFLYDLDGRGPVSDAAPLPDGRILLVPRRPGFDPVFTTILQVADPPHHTDARLVGKEGGRTCRYRVSP